MDFKEQYKHPLWQKKRLEVLSYWDFECQCCGSREDQLHVHHPIYKKGVMIWEYESSELRVLCNKCHEKEHELDQKIKQEIALLGVLSDGPAKAQLVGYLKAANIGPWSRLESYEEICGFLNYFNITGHIKEEILNSIILLDGDVDLFQTNNRTSFWDIGLACTCLIDPIEIMDSARESNKFRMDAFKARCSR